MVSKAKEEQTEIVVTAVIGRIPLSFDGTRSPFEAVLEMIGHDFGERVSGDGAEMEYVFDVFGQHHVFDLKATPIRDVKSSLDPKGWED